MLVFLLNVAGAAALLIYAVRMVRTGVERAFAVQLRRWLRASTGNRIAAAGSGAFVALLLQSATALAVMTAGFISTGAISAHVGLAMLLGADVGSAVVVQALVLRPSTGSRGRKLRWRECWNRLRWTGTSSESAFAD